MPGRIEVDRLRVVLVSPHNPLNIGAVARAMSNFGFSRLRVVNPYEAAFREARSAAGGASLLAAAEQYEVLADAIADCALVVGTTAVRHRELQHPLRRLEFAATLIRRHLCAGPVALLFGSEKTGLSNEDISHCHWLLRIPTVESNISMNLGQAAALCLYEIVRNARAATKSRDVATTSANSIEIERIVLVLLEALEASGYLGRGARTRAAEAKIRRLVHRLNIPADDAEIWMGVLRQILWKVRSEERNQESEARSRE